MKTIDLNICKFNISMFIRAIMLLSPVMLLFYEENGLSARDLLFFQGIFYLASILLEIPVGYLSDNYSRKHLLISSFAIFLFIIILWYFFSGYWIILIGEILFAISKDIMDNSMSGYLCDYSQNTKMARNYGYLNFFLAFGTAIASILGTFLYAKYGSNIILITQFILMTISILLISSLPNIKKSNITNFDFWGKINDFRHIIKSIYTNQAIKYHIFYSGTLVSFSILFAISFQPLMKNSYFPIALFGFIAFFNHITRSISGIIAGKVLRNLNINLMIIPLFILYIFAFGCIFYINNSKNIVINVALLILICFIISCQLIFTILHISRLYKFVSETERGSLMAANNFISRCFAAILLISTKVFSNSIGLNLFFIAAFLIFLLFGGYIMIKTYQVKE